MKKTLVITLVFALSIGFFLTPKSVNAQSCSSTEWNSLKQKYGIDELLQKQQEIVRQMAEIAHDAADLSKSYDAALYNSLQTQFDSLNIQLNNANTAAERECAALGADRANQPGGATENLESASSNEELKLLWAEYERALENYNNAAQNTCPPNSSLVGDLCYCNDGYINNGNTCVISVSSPTPKPTIFNTQTNKSKLRIAESTPTTTPTSTPENKTTTLQEENTPNTETEVERKPQGLIVRIFGAVKNFFSKFFRL